MAEENQQTQQQAQTQQQTPPINAGDLANSLLDALEARNRRTEGGIVRSYAQQYGMSEDEIKDILTNAKNERASKPTQAQQQQIDAALKKANDRLISAEIKTVGATLGLVDADVALSLIDKTKITVKDDGTVEGVKDALEALKTSKSYLFAAQEKPKKTGMRQTQGDPKTGKYDSANAALRAAFGKE